MSALIGRSSEHAALVEQLDQARSGRGSLMVIAGDPGIGKSALAQVAAETGAQRGFRVTLGKAWEFADAPPYFPLWPCLRALGLSAESGGFTLWDQVVEALAREEKPSLWVLEDLHAADQPTLELLCYLAQPLRALRALVIVTARRQDARLTPRAEQLLSRLARDGRSLDPAPLTENEVAELARRFMGEVAPRELRELVALTGGNPLFVSECARALKQRGASLPPTVRQLVQEQLGHLPTSAQTQLAAGAVLGREFTAAVVAKMGATLPARVIDDLAAALRSGLVAEARPGQFYFSHALVRDAIYDTLGTERRRTLHAAAAAALATLGEAAAVLVERTHHALLALSPDAFQLAERAIRMEEAQGAPDRAYALARRVDEMRRAAGTQTCEALIDLCRLAQAAGAWSESRRFCQEAIDHARGAGDGESLARAVLTFGAELRPAVIDPQLVRWLEDALAAKPAAPLRLRLQARLAAALQPAHDPSVPLAMARAAITEALAADDDVAAVEVLHFGGSALADFAPFDERITVARQLLERARRTHDRERALHACARLCLDELQSSHFEAFDASLDELEQLAHLLGHPRHRWRALLLRSMRALMFGQFAESERYIVEVEQMASLIDSPALPVSLVLHRMMRARIMHDLPALLALVPRVAEEGGAMAHARSVAWMFEASCNAWFGRPEGAAALLRQIPFVEPLCTAQNTLWPILSEAHAAAGLPEHVQRFIDGGRPYSDGSCVSGHVPFTYEGPVSRLLGLLHLRLGERAQAEPLLRQALAGVRARGLLPWIARVAYELSPLAPPEEAESLRSEARELAEKLGMTGLVDLLAQTTTQPAPAPVEQPALSMRLEGDVWAVVFDGRTVRVKDMRGLQLLSRLVSRADEELHVLGLASDEGVALTDSDAGELLDEKAARAYQARLRELDEELESADSARRERLHQERAFLEAELARGLGLHGEPRRAGSSTERARVNVQRRIKDAIKRLGDADAALGRYLGRAVRTGTYCSFRP